MNKYEAKKLLHQCQISAAEIEERLAQVLRAVPREPNAPGQCTEARVLLEACRDRIMELDMNVQLAIAMTLMIPWKEPTGLVNPPLEEDD